MKEWIISIAIIVAIIFLIYLLLKVNEKIRTKAYEFFLKAEHEFMSGEGEIKMDYVVSNVYVYLPAIIRVFMTEENLKTMLQKLFDEIKDLLDDGKFNDSMEVKENE